MMVHVGGFHKEVFSSRRAGQFFLTHFANRQHSADDHHTGETPRA